jgi:cation:H+ antiporter
MAYIFINMHKNQEGMKTDYKIFKPLVSVLLIILGLGALVIGSRVVVDNAVKIAYHLGASEKLIGITIVSTGTSLPELVTSVVAAFRKRSDLAIGNIIGSNIFNIFLILGLSSLIAPVTYNKSFNFDILLLTVSTILLLVFMYSGEKYKLDRWEAGIFLFGYFAYIAYLLI